MPFMKDLVLMREHIKMSIVLITAKYLHLIS